jgi:hypothetical protein
LAAGFRKPPPHCAGVHGDALQRQSIQHHFRIDRAIAQRLHQLAQQGGISPETLVNLWLAEKLRLDKPAAIAKKGRNKKSRHRTAIHA